MNIFTFEGNIHRVSENEFSSIFLLHLAQSNSNSPRSLEGFKTHSEAKFIRTPPHVMTLPKVSDFYNGVYKKILLSNPIEISTQSPSKTLKWSR